MAYRYEKNENGEYDLVIDGFEDGIADSPYEGITAMRNININYLKGGTYINYKRQRINTVGGSQSFTSVGNDNTLSASLVLNIGDAVVISGTTYFVSSVIGLVFQVSTTLGGSATPVGSGTVSLVTMGRPKYVTRSSGTAGQSIRTYILDDNGRVWQDSGTQAVTSFPYFVLLTGNNTSGAVGYGIAYWSNYLFVFKGSAIEVCGNGTGTSGITSANWANINSSGYFATNVTAEPLTAAPSPGDTTLTLASPWGYSSGFYQVDIGGGLQFIGGTFTNGSDTVVLASPVTATTIIDEINIKVFPSGAGEHMALAATDNKLYFCNNNYVGAISTPAGMIFDITDFSTIRVNYAALSLPTTETSVWLAELGVNLLVAGINYIYPWDRTSTSYSIPLPINENISRMINILNIVYVFAGQKGNIYTTNGYSISLLKKIPDSFLGDDIDPAWTFGGMMFHRYKLTFGASGLASDSSRITGVFSIDLTNNALNFESQNSFGLSANGQDATNILVDLNAQVITSSSYNPDRYYSAWYNGTNGGVDYNNTIPWGNYEAVIETDLVPVGTFLQTKTFLSAEFRLDKPMATGDRIKLSARDGISGSYIPVGETTTNVMSDIYTPLALQNFQWLQFKIERTGSQSSGVSTYVRLREVRIR